MLIAKKFSIHSSFTCLLLRSPCGTENSSQQMSLQCLSTTNMVFSNDDKILIKLECGPMPNVMAALPNTGGALCSTPQSLADAHYYTPCSNAVKT